MQEIEIVERYNSRLEPATVLIEKEGEAYHVWVYSHLHRDNEVLSYDRLKKPELVLRLLAWYKEQEQRNVPITKAVEYLTSQDESIQKALNPSPQRKGK